MQQHIQNVRNVHHSMIDWLLENPMGTQKELADYFGYSQVWVSAIINSDAFQAELARRREEISSAIVADVPTKLRMVATAALDGLMSATEEARDSSQKVIHRGFLKETADMALHRLGFAPNKGGVQVNAVQNNFIVENKEAALRARARLLERQQLKTLDAPAPEELLIETVVMEAMSVTEHDMSS